MQFLAFALLVAPAVFAQSALVNTTIHPNFNSKKCLDLAGNNQTNGTPVDLYDCNGTGAQNWTIIDGAGATTVRLAGTNFCLDAGSAPADGVQMKIWTCYDGLAAQQWHVTEDHRITLDGTSQCLDLYKGVLDNGNAVQTWTCSDNNDNQVWTLDDSKPPAPTTLALHPNGNAAKCIDVQGAKFADGTPVDIYDCNETAAQNFVLVKGETSVKVNGTNFCLDAGATPANGVQMKIWTCYDNLAAQQWFYTDDNRIALNGTGFCLDLPSGDVTNGKQLQIWQCTDNDVYQIWTQA